MNYDDWVYMGKETYGSKHTSRSSLKPGTKFFDVLGRTYNKMVAKLKYYVFKDAVQIETNVIAFEFEVWARIVKDSEGNDIPLNAPKNGLYGHSDFKLSLKFECKCNAFGKYQLSFSGNAINEKIEVFQSVWRYNDEEKYWHEHCRLEENLQRTYHHETQHIRNGRHIAITLNSYAKKDDFNTRKECENEGKKEHQKLMARWDEWYEWEQDHVNPSSPEIGRDRYYYPCN